MKRTPIQRRPIEWPTGPDRSAEFASHTMTKPIARLLTKDDTARHNPGEQKTPERKSQAIRDSARGEECQVRIPGVCTGNNDHTIWSHAPLGAAGKGRGIKSLDIAGAYCCTACDATLDQATGRAKAITREDVLLAWFEGHMRSLVILRQKGLV